MLIYQVKQEMIYVVDIEFKRYTGKTTDACICIKFFYWVSKIEKKIMLI